MTFGKYFFSNWITLIGYVIGLHFGLMLLTLLYSLRVDALLLPYVHELGYVHTPSTSAVIRGTLWEPLHRFSIIWIHQFPVVFCGMVILPVADLLAGAFTKGKNLLPGILLQLLALIVFCIVEFQLTHFLYLRFAWLPVVVAIGLRYFYLRKMSSRKLQQEISR